MSIKLEVIGGSLMVQHYVEALSMAGGKARREKASALGFGLRGDIELNFGATSYRSDRRPAEAKAPTPAHAGLELVQADPITRTAQEHHHG